MTTWFGVLCFLGGLLVGATAVVGALLAGDRSHQ